MSTGGHNRKVVRLRISGRVQGVGYRAWFAGKAEALRLSGFVRNRLDGTVEALLSGPDADVDALIALGWNGPPGARVDGIDQSPAHGITASAFRVLPTV